MNNSAENECAVEVNRLTVAYDSKPVLSNVDLELPRGMLTAVMGPNGAGKSSTIKILSGILTPDSGTCLVDGRIPWKDRVNHVRHIGVVFGQRTQLWWDVPVIDSYDLLKDIYSISKETYKHNLEELTELLDLKELLKTPARQLSLGQRMRCEIGASLLHGPKLLFFQRFRDRDSLWRRLAAPHPLPQRQLGMTRHFAGRCLPPHNGKHYAAHQQISCKGTPQHHVGTH